MAKTDFDCIVVGAGHAGAEAAHAAAVIGARTCLITISRDTIAKMSCNPAIGGLAKGQIVREVDALGGLMGLAIDATGIQFRMLNSSRGPAVQSPRAQADKYQYKDYIRTRLEQTENLTIVEAAAEQILTDNKAVRGVLCSDGLTYAAPTVIVTTGTFLRGLMHVGTEQSAGGRLGEPASNKLSDSLQAIGIELKRLKTGTPPRIDASTLDYDKLQIQHGDDEPTPFSFMNHKIDRPSIPCWITWTNQQIHELIRTNLSNSPLYTGQIESTGPRYCPSIETKIVRFADRERHQVFLEPEDAAQTSIYCNGISTSLPREIQQQMIRLLPGAENAAIIHYGYAIEYDYAPPIQLKSSLETRAISGLYLAGQINGTSGYEEAAGQGIVAGINAATSLSGVEPTILGRDQAYIGVLIDDLRTKGIDEPYRMFTSRAEFRLALRADNADRRLTQIGKTVGLVQDDRWSAFAAKLDSIRQLHDSMTSRRIAGRSLHDLLKRPGSNIQTLISDHAADVDGVFSDEILRAVTIDARYEGYLVKQSRLTAAAGSLENKSIPAGIDYNAIQHLRAEAREKLIAFKPENLGQASRISGITPADITVLQIHMKKHHRPTAKSRKTDPNQDANA